MLKIKVKPEHADKQFGFNNSAKPLGERDDLHVLVADAKANGYQHILDMFEEVPSDEQLSDSKENAFNEKQKDKNRQSEK